MSGGSATAQVLARMLAIDSTAANAMGCMADAGIDAVLIKGPTLSAWLYPAGLRPYGDADILVDPSRYADAEGVLATMGYVAAQADEWEGSEFQPHARPWVRPTLAGSIDLHRTLPGLRTIGPPSAWAVLREHRDELTVAGRIVPMLDEAGRLVLVALHAHHHGISRGGRPVADLERAIEVGDETAWRAAALLAAELDATAGLTIALRSQPAGDDLADRLGLPPSALVETTIPGAEGPMAMGIERLAATRGLRKKAALVARELTPSPSYLRYSSRRARRGPIGLASEYVHRTASLLRLAPPSVRAWYRARRSRR